MQLQPPAPDGTSRTKAPSASADSTAIAGHRSREPDTDGISSTRPTAGRLESVERMEVVDLRRLVASLPVIEQAKGMLMAYYGCDADTAFAVLRRWSSTRNIKLRDLAATLVEHAAAPRSPARQAKATTLWQPAQALRDFLDVTDLH